MKNTQGTTWQEAGWVASGTWTWISTILLSNAEDQVSDLGKQRSEKKKKI